MGYFSNGTEGEMYYAQWCDRCIHERKYRETMDDGCAVWAAHLLCNYDRAKGENDINVLDVLIPRSEDGIGNEQCKMFLQIGPDNDPTQLDIFRPPMKEDPS